MSCISALDSRVFCVDSWFNRGVILGLFFLVLVMVGLSSVFLLGLLALGLIDLDIVCCSLWV